MSGRRQSADLPTKNKSHKAESRPVHGGMQSEIPRHRKSFRETPEDEPAELADLARDWNCRATCVRPMAALAGKNGSRDLWVSGAGASAGYETTLRTARSKPRSWLKKAEGDHLRESRVLVSRSSKRALKLTAGCLK